MGLEDLAQAPIEPRISRQMETAKELRYSRVSDWRIICRVNEAGGDHGCGGYPAWEPGMQKIKTQWPSDPNLSRDRDCNRTG
ncbi:MAG: hypothetical protein JRI66_11320 [Deltaproteobacteria bacterium]|nr:hypothetical protein [Deltaproteobacteria bacterium]